MKIRKSVSRLSSSERANFVAGVKGLKSGKRYDIFVKMHLWATYYATPNGSNQAHMGPAFLPWHREFILRFENALRDQLNDPNFALPYWDWAADATLADPTKATIWGTDFMGGQGSPVTTGPFAAGQWSIWAPDESQGGLVRTFGENTPTLPTSVDVNAAIPISTYDSAPWNTTSTPSFRNTLEGWINGPQLHNRVHVWVGGSMVPMTSPNDPVFFLHHSNVDRIWAAWQARNPGVYLPETGGPQGHNLNDKMWPWLTKDPRTPGMELDYPSLGYVYDYVAIASGAFPNVFLRMDGTNVSQNDKGSGTVNCQASVGSYEKFLLLPQSDGTVAIASTKFSNVYMRMDGGGVTGNMQNGGGTVNCQASVGSYERFQLLPQGNGAVAIASTAFPNVYLRMDGSKLTGQNSSGSGTVNCTGAIGEWEKFYLVPIL